MSMFSSRFGAALVAGALLLGSAPAFAQQQPVPGPAGAPGGGAPQGPIKVDLLPVNEAWTKECVKDEAGAKQLCSTSRVFTAQKDQPPALALFVYEVTGDENRVVRLVMPFGLMLRPGFRFIIDKGQPSDGAFEICMPNGCLAEAKVKKDVIEGAKKGTTMTVQVKNQFNAEVQFNIPLAGFGKAFDGPAIDPKVLEEQRKKMADDLQKRAEEERKKLESQQGGAPAAK